MATSRWAAAILCCAVLVACTPEADEAQPTPSASPTRGGLVEIGILGEPSTLDPYGDTASDLTYALARPVFPMPYRMLPEGTTAPELARSLEVTPNGARLVIEDRRWSNGRRITARDVVASIRRATPPSGFHAITKARAVGRATIQLRGRVNDWETTLATGAFVMPHGRLDGGNVSGGPFRFSAYDRGRKLSYVANRESATPPLLDRVEVSFVQGTELLIRLLERGDIDAAWLPSTVNLSDRLDELGLPHASAFGSERLVMAFEPSRIGRSEVRALLGRIGLVRLGDSFLRGEGEVVSGFGGKTASVPSLVSLAAPEGDELLTLMQRAIQIALRRSNVTTELITGPVSTLYGEWRDSAPADVLLQRSMTGGWENAIPIASVATFLAWRDGVQGLVVNPSLDGPLWNAREWWIDPSI